MLQWQSLGHGHGRVGVGIEEFFVERGEEDVDCFGVQLLESLELLGVERAQGRQRWDSANQLRDERDTVGGNGKFRLVDSKLRKHRNRAMFLRWRRNETGLVFSCCPRTASVP